MKSTSPNWLTPLVIPNIQGVRLLEYFLISAVSAFLSIRLFLHLTGYPQVGGGNLHIAHMLWGGLLMFFALVLVLVFLGFTNKTLAAIIGGIGFGTFIDELGKFITADNDYFFQPSVALIYLIFVGIFLLIKLVQENVSFSPQVYALNAIEYVREIILDNFDRAERNRALQYLKQSDGKNQIVKTIESLILHADTIPVSSGLFQRWGQMLRQKIQDLIANRWLYRIVILILLVHSILSLLIFPFFFVVNQWNFGSVGYTLSELTVTGLTAVGMYLYFFRKKKLLALKLMIYATLVSIFVSQFFLFWFDQLSAVSSLFTNVLIYAVLDQMRDKLVVQLAKK